MRTHLRGSPSKRSLASPVMTANFLGEKSSPQPETLQDCLKQSIVARSDIERAAAALLETAEAVSVGDGIYATLPSFETLPPQLRQALVDIVLRGRV